MKLLFLITALFFVIITSAQNVGIGTSTPIARLHVADSNVLFTGPLTVPGTTTYNPPASGAGSRMMWYPQKAAFRVGFVNGTQWDKDSIGRFSFSSGYNTKAIGAFSTSMGNGTIASALLSTSMGYVTNASGDFSTSMGYGTYASGYASTSMGYGTIAMGDYSASMGFGTVARSDHSLVIGSFNDTTAGHRLFEIGNGTDYNLRNNAMTVLTNGNIGIGTTSPNASALMDVSSTAKGFLPPRMTKAQGVAIANPVPGLMIWCSNCGANGELNVYNGTAWTNMIGNPTSPVHVPPTVITTAISQINSTSAVSGGNVTSDGYSAVTVRGVCWDIATNPTLALPTKTNNGTGTGIFASNITGLTKDITYYVRAYATNAIGTSYGAEFSFTTVLGIGDTYQGGIVAYILQPSDPGYIAGQTHGLIAAASDQSTAAEWGCNGTALPGAEGTALGTGNQNTIDIMAGCATAGIAARLCGNLVLNGCSDWYLPSFVELNKLYINRVAIGGFASNYYWSSSENDFLVARNQNFNNGMQGNFNKSYL